MKRVVMMMTGAVVALVMQCQVALAQDYGTITITREQIEEVYDGDTIMLQVAEWPSVLGQHIGVRIKGMDTPERHSHCLDATAKANEEAQALLARTQLLAMLDSGQPIQLRHMDRDKYFRILAEVWVGEQNVATVLVAKGMAVSYHGEKKVGWCTPTIA